MPTRVPSRHGATSWQVRDRRSIARVSMVAILLAVALGVGWWMRRNPAPVPIAEGFADPLQVEILGTDRDEELIDMDLNASGEWAVLLNTDGDIPGETHQGVDLLVAKYSAEGTLLWQDLIGSEIDDRGTSIELSDAGDVWVAGDSFGALPGTAGQGERDGFLVHYSGAGVVRWIAQIATPFIERARDLAVLEDGSSYVVGTTYGEFGGHDNAGKSREAWIARFSPEGRRLWIKEFGSTESDTVVGVTVGDDKSAYFVGYTDALLADQASGGRDVFLGQISSGGNILWSRQFGTESFDFGAAIEISEGVVTVVGNLGRDTDATPEDVEATVGFIARFTRDGTQLSLSRVDLGGCTSIGAVASANDSVTYVGGSLSTVGCEEGTGDAFLAALYPDGSLRAIQVVMTPELDHVAAVHRHSGRVWIGGTIGEAGAVGWQSLGGWDGFVAELLPVEPAAWIECRSPDGSDTTRVAESKSRPQCPRGWTDLTP